MYRKENGGEALKAWRIELNTDVSMLTVRYELNRFV